MTDLSEVASLLAEAGRALHARGFCPATSGNFSAVLGREPLALAISRSGVDKGRLHASDFLKVDASGVVLEGDGRPSAETVVHLAVVRGRSAGAVLHTHSVWSTLVSEAAAEVGGLALQGYEMLKGLADVTTHEYREWIPVSENAQNYGDLSAAVTRALAQNPAAHGLLLRGHGLYTWGRDLDEAQRHVEALEFLLEVEGRLAAASGSLRRTAVAPASAEAHGDR